MSPTDVLNELEKQGILPGGQRTKLTDYEYNRPLSLHYELRIILYAGVLLLSSGLGLLVYDNFDQIGHGVLLTVMAVACAGCFAYAWRFRPPWTVAQTHSQAWPGPASFGDYALLLGCLLFLTLEGYAQYAYTIFGTRYGLVTLLPAGLFLPLAYRFDHRGVLSLALTALISWVGVTVRPLDFYLKTNFFDQRTVFSAIALGCTLVGLALMLANRRIKPHFTNTYLTMGGNLLLVALLGGLFNFEGLRLGFALGLAGACFAFDRYRYTRLGRQEPSFLFLLMGVVYGYIGVTYLFFHYLQIDNLADAWFYWYFILTGSAAVYYLINQLPKQTAPRESL